jgi:hypothetical protein
MRMLERCRTAVSGAGFALRVAEQSNRKTVTRAKTQSPQGSEKINKCLTLRAWRLGGINFLKVALFNISKVSAQYGVR